MIRVLKSGSVVATARVRPIHSAMERSIALVDPERERLQQHVESLSVELAETQATVERLKGEIEQAFRDGKAEGREAGRKEVDDRSETALRKIDEGITRALDMFDGEMKGLDRLAALLAQTCLDRLLLASDERGRIVGELIAGQVAALAADSAIRVEVSPEDFASGDALAQLSDGLGGRCEVSASSGLKSGDCRIGLRLGGLEVGIGQQWGVLRSTLDSLIDGGGR